jgi:hypothetical protein
MPMISTDCEPLLGWCEERMPDGVCTGQLAIRRHDIDRRGNDGDR